MLGGSYFLADTQEPCCKKRVISVGPGKITITNIIVVLGFGSVPKYGGPPNYYKSYAWDPHKGTPNFGKPPENSGLAYEKETPTWLFRHHQELYVGLGFRVRVQLLLYAIAGARWASLKEGA